MSAIDWIILAGTLAFIVAYGVWKTRHVSTSESYLLGDRDLPWWTIGLSVMATQASAITFLSTPGQAYDDGMRFAQFYFGLPIAMVILCIFVLPIYYRLKVYTAYEYLESRFDLKTRTLTALLFLIQRGLAAGITIFAPAIILSTILGWNLNLTILVIGMLVIIYTVFGGTKAVSQTQKQQMLIILLGMGAAFGVLVFQLPEDISFGNAVGVAGKMGKLNVVDFEFDLSNRYNIWSALLGGTFLFLSYFGTDQSQVSRYLSGKSLTQSRLGLLFNGIFKVPMQFMILFVGIMVYMFFQFTKPPIHYNQSNTEQILQTEYAGQFQNYQESFDKIHTQKQKAIRNLIAAFDQKEEQAIAEAQSRVKVLQSKDVQLRNDVRDLILKSNPNADVTDSDYVFITFITQYLPKGLIGLLLAVIFSAAMSSTSSELNALGTTTVVDIYRRSFAPDLTDAQYLAASKLFTIGWGIIALGFAMTARLAENLIEFVNIIGSLFYGTILGIFLVAFFFKWVGSRAVFIAAIIAEGLVIVTFFLDHFAYLWLNLIGCALVVVLSIALQLLNRNRAG